MKEPVSGNKNEQHVPLTTGRHSEAQNLLHILRNRHDLSREERRVFASYLAESLFWACDGMDTDTTYSFDIGDMVLLMEMEMVTIYRCTFVGAGEDGQTIRFTWDSNALI